VLREVFEYYEKTHRAVERRINEGKFTRGIQRRPAAPGFFLNFMTILFGIKCEKVFAGGHAEGPFLGPGQAPIFTPYGVLC